MMDPGTPTPVENLLLSKRDRKILFSYIIPKEIKQLFFLHRCSLKACNFLEVFVFLGLAGCDQGESVTLQMHLEAILITSMQLFLSTCNHTGITFASLIKYQLSKVSVAVFYCKMVL